MVRLCLFGSLQIPRHVAPASQQLGMTLRKGLVTRRIQNPPYGEYLGRKSLSWILVERSRQNDWGMRGSAGRVAAKSVC